MNYLPIDTIHQENGKELRLQALLNNNNKTIAYDLRQFALSKGKMVATKSGIRISVKHMPQFVLFIQNAMKASL